MPMSGTEETVRIEASRTETGPARQKSDRHLRTLIHALWTGEARMRVLLLAGGISTVILATAFGQGRLNARYRPFYHAIRRKGIVTFFHQLVVFRLIVSVLLGLDV